MERTVSRLFVCSYSSTCSMAMALNGTPLGQRTYQLHLNGQENDDNVQIYQTPTRKGYPETPTQIQRKRESMSPDERIGLAASKMAYEKLKKKHEEKLREKDEEIHALKTENSQLAETWQFKEESLIQEGEIERDRLREQVEALKRKLEEQKKQHDHLEARNKELVYDLDNERMERKMIEEEQQQRRENKLSLISDEHELDSLEPPYAEGESHLYESDLSLEGEDLFDQNEQTVAEESVKQSFEKFMMSAKEKIEELEVQMDERDAEIFSLENILEQLEKDKQNLEDQLNDRIANGLRSPLPQGESLSQFQNGMPPTPEPVCRSPPITPSPIPTRSPIFGSKSLSTITRYSRTPLTSRGSMINTPRQTPQSHGRRSLKKPNPSAKEMAELKEKFETLKGDLARLKKSYTSPSVRYPRVPSLRMKRRGRGGNGDFLTVALAFFGAVLMCVVMLLSHSLTSPMGGVSSLF